MASNKNFSKITKQKNNVLSKYDSLSDEEINDLCTYLQIKTDSAKVWISGGIALLIATLYKNGDLLTRLIWNIFSFLNRRLNNGQSSTKVILRTSENVSLGLKILITIIFFMLVYVAYLHQKSLNWLLRDQNIRATEKIKQDLKKSEQKIQRSEQYEEEAVKRREEYYRRQRQRRRLN